MPVFQTQFLLPLVGNLQTILEERLPDAIIAIDPELAPIVETRTPLQLAERFPAWFIKAVGADLEQADDDGKIAAVYELTVTLGAIGADAWQIQQDVLRYGIALDRVIRQMTATDWKGGDPSTLAIAWEPVRWNTDLRANAQGAFLGLAELTIIIQRTET